MDHACTYLYPCAAGYTDERVRYGAQASAPTHASAFRRRRPRVARLAGVRGGVGVQRRHRRVEHRACHHVVRGMRRLLYALYIHMYVPVCRYSWCVCARARARIRGMCASATPSLRNAIDGTRTSLYYMYTPCIFVSISMSAGYTDERIANARSPHTRAHVLRPCAGVCARVCACDWAPTHPRRHMRARSVGVDRVRYGSQAFQSAMALNTNIGAWNTASVSNGSGLDYDQRSRLRPRPDTNARSGERGH